MHKTAGKEFSWQFISTLVISLFILTSCLQDGRVAWSPDGSKFAAICADGLRIAEDNGDLSAPYVKDATYLSWYPDGKRLLVISSAYPNYWTDLKNLLAPEDAQEIITTAQMLKNSLLQCQGNFNLCKQSLSQSNFSGDFVSESLLYLKETSNSELTQALGSPWKGLVAEPVSVSTIQVWEFTDKGLVPDKVLWRTTKCLESVRISPNAKLIALVDEAATRRLLVLPASGHPLLASRNVAAFPDWSPDGRSLVFISETKQDSNNNKLTGALNRLEIVSQDDPLKLSFGSRQNLCSVAYDKDARVRFLKNGAVLFASCHDTAQREKDWIGTRSVKVEELYELKSGSNKPDLLASRTYGNKCGLCVFEISPDQTKVSLPSSNSSLDVLSLLDHKVIHAPKTANTDKSLFAPCWRTSDELCFTVPVPLTKPKAKAEEKTKEEEKQQVVLWSLSNKTLRTISDTWPKAAVSGLLEKTAETELSLSALFSQLKELAPRQDSTSR